MFEATASKNHDLFLGTLEVFGRQLRSLLISENPVDTERDPQPDAANADVQPVHSSHTDACGHRHGNPRATHEKVDGLLHG